MVKNLPPNAGDLRKTGSIPGLGRSSGGGHDNSFQCSYMKNSMDRGTWQAIVHGVTKSCTRLTNFHFHFTDKGVLFYAKRNELSSHEKT